MVSAPFVEKTILSSTELSGSCFRNQLNVKVYFWIFTPIPCIYMLIFLPVTRRLGCCSFVVTFNNERYKSLYFVPFRDHFSYSM